MVLPLGAMSGGLFAMAPPSEEFLRLKPFFKMAVIALAFAVVVELAAGYVPAALTDIITVMFGFILLRRDFGGLMQGLPAFTVIAAFNFLFQSLTLLQFLLITPGFEHFFSDHCPTSVKRRDADGHETHEIRNLCSWRTILGNAALLAAVLIEFACVRLSWKMVRSMRDVTSSMFSSASMPMMDVEGGSLTGQMAAQLPTAQRTQAPGQAGRTPGLAGPTAGNAGFTPFSGAPHRLGDD
jgi:large-conductance mechanosensitive channel